MIYEAREETAAQPPLPIFEIELQAGFSVFEHCLEPGRRYGWAVAAVIDGVERWSEPAVFDIVAPVAPTGAPRRSAASTGDVGTRSGSAVLAPAPPPSFDAPLADALGPRALPGAAFSPPPCASVFSDVPPSSDFCPWIEQLARDRITAGCGGGNYCPKAPVTREQFALLLERSMRGTDTFRPGSTTADVPNRPPSANAVSTVASFVASGHGRDTSITIGADGLGLMSFISLVPDFFSAQVWLSVAHCTQVDCVTAGTYPVGATAFIQDPGVYSSITIGADGLGLVSYELFGDLLVAHCTNVECSATQITSLDIAGDVGAYASITIGADGLGLISYHDVTNGDLKVAHCSNLECSTATITSLDSAGNVGKYSSITVGADGLGLISYLDETNPSNRALKVAHCSNVNCSAATKTFFDPLGDVGQYTSITIGADGLGLVSYYDATSADLKVAHCTDLKCSAATLNSLDTEGDYMGVDTSITIGADGLPLIAYQGQTPFVRVQRVAHCADPLCAPYFRRR